MTKISIEPDPLDRGMGIHDQYGRSFLVSQSDLPLISTLSSFFVRKDGYVSVRYIGKKKLLHRVLLNLTDPATQVDHINRNRTDNRRSNLRLASLAENNRNQAKRKHNTSGFKGVSFDKNRGLFQVGIGVNGGRIALGRYATAEEAARIYDDAARKYYGAFAVLNFPDEE